MTDEVIYEEVDEIAIIAINRPEKKNRYLVRRHHPSH